MKKLLLFILLLPLFSKAQTVEPKSHMFAEIVGTARFLSNKVSVSIDYGQETKYFSEHKNKIIDAATGKPKIFNSMVDAMNYMATLGWDFVQAYVITEGSQNACHWLMRKELSEKEVEKYLPMIKGDIKNE